MDENLPEEKHYPDRWTLLRDMIVLQVKLVVDGFRDLVLLPASLIACIVSLVRSEGDRPGPEFYQLISWGKQSELWINLFGAYRHAPPEVTHDNPFAEANIDDLIGKFESFVVEEHRRGGVTAQAKERIDKALNAIQRRQNDDKT